MLRDFFILGLNNLKRRKLRSWLTMLGIFIGIAAVVSLISLGQGLQETIKEQFEMLGSDKIVIQPKGMGTPGSAVSDQLILKQKDLEFIENIRGVEWVIGYLVKTGQAKFKDEAGIGFGIGLNPEDWDLSLTMQGFDVIEGRGLKKGDKFKVVVGYNHAFGDIWKRGIRVGETIEIEGQDFKVIGVLETTGNPYDDGSLYVAKEVLAEILNVEDEESQILVKVAKGFEPSDLAETIKRKLRKFRGEKEDQETFTIQTSEQLLNTFQNIFGVVQGVLVGIAAISLLVGGIGIMNTMYTSVIERTKEIGTMKAIGAKNSHILLLFLIESGLLGLVGGLIGVGIGIGLAKGAESIAKIYLGTPLLQASMNPLIMFGALTFSFIIGTLSGILPALQASKLKPVDALRYE